VVRAAGGVVWRRRGRALEVLIAHRPKYDDWSLPKGKCEGDETDEDCARREVREETGLVCALGPELLTTDYLDQHGRPKRVRYWSMTVTKGEFIANDEVDEVRWLPDEEAAAMLSYQRDVDVLESFVETAPSE
jgi:8-oxo-dGTP diphosphatase